ncbi:MAG TPA: hypothetical protein VHS54_10730, partial [Jatrophihabitans sp.]|nr:hypothetical protein [Jatrophihabitans sp.]
MSAPERPTGWAAAARSGTHWIRVAGERLSHLAQRSNDAWRRSLQLRVGASTVAVAGVVVLVIGIFLVDKVSGGVLRAKRDAAVNQAKIGLPTASAILQSVD